MKQDKFLMYLYRFSTLSVTTQKIYRQWVTHCCRWNSTRHLLDVTPAQIEAFRLWLLDDKHYSYASSTIVYNALRHTYAILLPQVDATSAQRYARLFRKAPRQAYRLPQSVSVDLMQKFCDALPKTAVGFILREMYRTGAPFDALSEMWKCSRGYAQAVCARTARQVGIPQGFGVSGVRSTGIIHRIQARRNDTELPAIREAAGLSPVQFQRYVQAAGTEKMLDKI